MTKDFPLALSVLIITLNEEQQMPTLLSGLDFASEIIVVDSFSTDSTAEVSKGFSKVKFYQNKFENYAAQRNYALSLASNDWVLFLDADERLTPDLQNEIKTTLQNPTAVAYLFRRTFMFENEILRFSGNQTDKIFRLFNKKYAQYANDKLVHEKLQVRGKIATLRHRLIHYSYTDYNSYKAKTVRYGELKAQEKFLKNEKVLFGSSFFHPLYNFLYNYIARLGFLDGKKGLIICYLNANSVRVRYQKLKQLWKESNLPPKK